MILYEMLLYPIRKLYLQGPRINGFGFWQGSPLSEICASITSIPVEHWNINNAECEAVINKKFDAIVVSLECILFMYIYMSVLRTVFLILIPSVAQSVLLYARHRLSLPRKKSKTFFFANVNEQLTSDVERIHGSHVKSISE